MVAPGAVSASRYAAPVVISDVRVGNGTLQNYQSGNPVRMAQADRVIQFTFAALDFSAPERNQFRYRLHGFEEDWVDAGTRHEATYSNLDPGQYEFRVLASNHDGFWNETAAAVPLTVVPAWWNSAWMKAIIAAFGLLAVVALWQGLRRKNREQRLHAVELQDRDCLLYTSRCV